MAGRSRGRAATLRRIDRTLVIALATLAAALALLSPAPAPAEPAAGIVAAPGTLLATLDTAAPGTFTSTRPVAGLQPGEQLAALAVRPGDGTLYGLGIVPGATDTARLYRIDPGTGTATQVGAAIPNLTTSAAYGAAFDPTSGMLRVVNGAGENGRIDPDDGDASDDGPLSESDVAAIAYTDAGGLLGLWHAPSELVTIDGASGLVTSVGALGIASGLDAALNLDVAPSGTAYATALPAGGAPGLYAADLATGALTLAGTLPAALRAFAVLPTTTVRFTATAYAAAEGGAATVTVVRDGPAAGTASVAYATADGSATSADYVPAAGVLTFAPGQTARTFTVSARDDGTGEGDETVSLALGSPTAPLALGSPSTATLAIADDEAVTPPPNVRLKRIAKTIRLRALLRRGIRVTATPNKPVRLTFALLGRTRLARLSAGENLALVTRTPRGVSARRRTVVLRPRRALVGRPTASFRVRVQVIATDDEGRERIVNRVVLVKVPAPSTRETARRPRQRANDVPAASRRAKAAIRRAAFWTSSS